MSPLGGMVLVVDDVPANRSLLVERLHPYGLDTRQASNGREALDILRNEPIDLVLLDIMMPEVDGYEVLEAMSVDDRLRYVPVLVLSAMNQFDSVIRCIELGADDYLTKPCNPVLLLTRVRACLERKKLRDREIQHLRTIEDERRRSEELLLNVMPREIAHRLKREEKVIADSHPEVSILFADIVGFTDLSARLSPVRTVELLDAVFSRFDALAEELGLEKIKTIGDAYLVVAGLPQPRPDHAEAIAEMALRMHACLTGPELAAVAPLQLRVGINSGPAVAGVIGRRRFCYDLWGDAVNVASRMESLGLPGRIHVTAETASRLADRYVLEPRGDIPVKGKGSMQTFFLVSRR